MISQHDKLSEHMPVLRDAISHLLYDAARREHPRGGLAKTDKQVGDVGTSSPLEVFRVRADRIRDGAFLKEAEHSGWQYLLTGPGFQAIADVREDGGVASFGRLIHGHLAEGLAKAARLATEDHAKEQDYFQPRILEIPALYIVVLWMHGAYDVFYPIAFTKNVDRQRYDLDAFAKLVVGNSTAFNAD